MTDKLTLYNLSLKKLRERRLTALTENVKARRELDAVYDTTVKFCLGQGLWRFAKRVVSIDASTTVTPAFGYINAFTIPDDWIATVVISAAPNLDPPLQQFAEETGYWFANATPLYVSYISLDPLYGYNLGAWPETFTDYVADRLAVLAGPDITNSSEIIGECKEAEKASRRRARAKDAMNDPAGIPPVSQLVLSRRGGFGSRVGFSSSGEN